MMVELKCGCKVREKESGEEKEVSHVYKKICKHHRGNAGKVLMLNEIIGQQAMIKHLEEYNEIQSKRAQELDEKLMDIEAGENDRTSGFEFTCHHYCEHCKAGDVPQRVSDEQIKLVNDRTFTFPNEDPNDFYWRHTRRDNKTVPLCKVSSLREAWRSQDE